MPDGVFNVVHGDKEAVDALLHHPGIDAVSFVGSTPIAKYIYATAAANGKRVQALGGAKNHAVVLPDADLDFAADALIGAAYGSAGERCMAISAVVAVGDAADPLVADAGRAGASAEDRPGHRREHGHGPARHRARTATRCRATSTPASSEGATLVVDGRGFEVPGSRSGFFLGPTLFDHVTPEMTIYKDEIFGPVLVVLRVTTLDEAIDARQQQPVRQRHGDLHELGRRRAPLRGARSRSAWSASTCRFPVPMAFFSFGGWKQSLFGDLHVHGIEGINFYTRTKAVTTPLAERRRRVVRLHHADARLTDAPHRASVEAQGDRATLKRSVPRCLSGLPSAARFRSVSGRSHRGDERPIRKIILGKSVHNRLAHALRSAIARRSIGWNSELRSSHLCRCGRLSGRCCQRIWATLSKSPLRPKHWRRSLDAARTLWFDYGHLRSVHSRRPVDAAGNPIPWYTYPAVSSSSRSTSHKARSSNTVGNSTLFWASAAARVVSVEDDDEWYATLAPQIPPNCHLTLHADLRNSSTRSTSMARGST